MSRTLFAKGLNYMPRGLKVVNMLLVTLVILFVKKIHNLEIDYILYIYIYIHIMTSSIAD